MKKYFSVKAKCGHVGKMNCVWVDFAVTAESAKEAAMVARNFARVKHQHKDAIASVQEIRFEEYELLRSDNYADPFLQCHNKQEQQQIVGFDMRISVDEHNINKHIQKRSKKESLEYRSKKLQLIDKSLSESMRDYVLCGAYA
jgi:hypothetical protein